MKPSEINALIAQHVYRSTSPLAFLKDTCKSYSTSLDLALEVLDTEKAYYEITPGRDKKYAVGIPEHRGSGVYVEHRKLPMAICRAVLLTKGVTLSD